MSETIRLILTKFTDETIVIFSLLLLMTMMGIIIYWFYNRKKFHQLSHEIPASVVKNYLDSIIQNSNSLKSSLFRGGGLDMGNGVPSVVAIGDLPTSKIHSVGVAGEEVSQKNAEIAALTLKLNDRFSQIQDLEKTIQDLSANKGLGAESEMLKKDLMSANIKIKDLEERLKNVSSGSANNVGVSAELESVKNERDELLERLKEYAVIEEDLANLKRLQQENEQLKAQVDEFKRLIEVDDKGDEDEEIIGDKEIAPLDDMDDLEAAMAEAIAQSQKAPVQEAVIPPEEIQELEIKGGDLAKDEGESKSGEELLSEFEKMLG